MNLDNYISLKQQIQQARIVAVSKSVSLSQIEQIYNLGQKDFAENYIQELKYKAQNLRNLAINWHFIGRIQSNKIKTIAKLCCWVQSLTEISHAVKLNASRDITLPQLNVLIEVNISCEASKHGLNSFTQILDLVNEIKQLPQLKLRGLMGMASNSSRQTVQSQFSKLYNMYINLQQQIAIDTLSMGMSMDYNIALNCGSNMLRIGSKIFKGNT